LNAAVPPPSAERLRLSGVTPFIIVRANWWSERTVRQSLTALRAAKPLTDCSRFAAPVRQMTTKSQKELAFLQDLYVATDWGERFAELVDEHVELPKQGSTLYLAAGTGEHAMALQERAGKKLIFVCVDENEECLELARAKAAVLGEQTEFQREDLNALSFPEGRFDLVLGDTSLTPPGDLKQILAEMVRVAKPASAVAFWLPTASSFGEFFSIYWEALLSADLQDHGIDVETLITEEPTVAVVEALAARAGLENITSWTTVEEFDYESGEQFLNSPLITDFLMKNWLRSVPEAARERVLKELARIIDEERHEGEFALTVKATLVVGVRSPTVRKGI
jgi:ubiquinone/menaquinone biosynthesis C-methylase UbiE